MNTTNTSVINPSTTTNDNAMACMERHKKILAPLIAEYCAMEADKRKQVDDLMEARRKMKKDFREGILADAKEFQQAMTLIQRALVKAKGFLAHFDVDMFQRELPIFYEDYVQFLARPDVVQALAKRNAPKEPQQEPERQHGMRPLRPLRVDPVLSKLYDFYDTSLQKLSLGDSTIYNLIDRHIRYE